eukprot:TRINITY_DN433_c0_g1_i2.p1 TRINITY_DN433_c0_g1~~TRINITY_DN433_c0_g1_i2.p1  ORF type:complete len:393 (-),score=36.17 TRINITY_DN433_c0_g1_i2:50-1228(-)
MSAPGPSDSVDGSPRQMSKTTLFVGGLSTTTRAKDLAYEFERFGPLIRCDVPTPGGKPRGFAFIEFVDERDAEEAYESLKYSKIDGRDISLQWAKQPPAPGWKAQRVDAPRTYVREPERPRERDLGRIYEHRDRYYERPRSPGRTAKRSLVRRTPPRSYYYRISRSPSARSPYRGVSRSPPRLRRDYDYRLDRERELREREYRERELREYREREIYRERELREREFRERELREVRERDVYPPARDSFRDRDLLSSRERDILPRTSTSLSHSGYRSPLRDREIRSFTKDPRDRDFRPRDRIRERDRSPIRYDRFDRPPLTAERFETNGTRLHTSETRLLPENGLGRKDVGMPLLVERPRERLSPSPSLERVKLDDEPTDLVHKASPEREPSPL